MKIHHIQYFSLPILPHTIPPPHHRAMTDVAGSAQRHLAGGGGANPNPILFHIKRQINHL